MVATDS
jgi:putative phosphoribosyl transferase